MKGKSNFDDEKSTARCPFCDGEVLPEATKCHICHNWLSSKKALNRKKAIKLIEKPSFMKCPYCAEEVLDYVIVCKHCLEKISKKKSKKNKNTKSETSETETSESRSERTKSRDSESDEEKPKEAESKPEEKVHIYYQPGWQLVLLSIVTLNIYQIYWFYRNWKFMKIHMGSEVHPLLNLLLLFVPVLGFVLIYRQIKDIDNYSRSNEIQNNLFPALAFLLWCVFLSEGSIVVVLRVMGYQINILVLMITLFIVFLSIAPLTLVQNSINQIIIKKYPNAEIGKKFSILSIIFMIGGFGGWYFMFKFFLN